MKALTLRATGQLHRGELPVPDPATDHIRVRVSHCAVCRTDAKMWQQGQRDLVLPRVLGHEVVGRAEPDGEAVAIWPGVACGSCSACRGGRENLCPDMQVMGFHRDGGFAEWVQAPAPSVLPLPAGLDPALATLAEPLACGLNALQRAGAGSGQRLLVCGGGPVGLLLALAGRHLGCAVAVAERSRERIARAAPFRAALGIDRADPADPVDRPSYEVAVNAAPALDCVTSWLPAIVPGGCYVLFSGLTGKAALPAAAVNEIHYRELSVCGAYGCTREQMQQALPLLQQHATAARLLIEAEIGLAGVEAALAAVLAGNAFKYVVRPDR